MALSVQQYHRDESMLRSSPTVLSSPAVSSAADSSNLGIVRGELNEATLVFEVTIAMEMVVSECLSRRYTTPP